MRALLPLAGLLLALSTRAAEPSTSLMPPPPPDVQIALLQAPGAAKHLAIHAVDETCFTPQNMPAMGNVGLDQSGTKDASKSELTLDAPTAESFAAFQTAIDATMKGNKKKRVVYGLRWWGGKVRGVTALCIDDKPLLQAKDMKPGVTETYTLTFDSKALGKLKSMKKGQFRVAAVYDGVLAIDVSDIREVKTKKAPVAYNVLDLAPEAPEAPETNEAAGAP